MKCSSITRSGERCKGVAIDGSSLCYSHHPDYAEDRRRAARKGGQRGGRGRPQVEVAELRAQLSDLYSSVLTDMVEPKVGAVLAQITNAQIRLTEVELKVREAGELEERLARLESLSQQQGGANTRRGGMHW
jgi:hypothetical protein